jgi:hypothetical protein
MFQSTLLWQNDPQWADDPLGFGPPTIKEWGCLMTSLTMVVNGFGCQETPRTFNQKMKAAGGFAGALIKAGLVSAVCPGVSVRGRDDCGQAPAPIAAIDAALASGQPVILQVDWSPQPDVQSHWVLAYARQGNDYLILDPYHYPGDAPGKPLTLLSRYHFSGSTLEQAISSVIYLSGAPSAAGGAPPVTPPVAKTPVPSPALTVYTATDNLALRDQPDVAAALITRLPLGAALICLEASPAAQAKVGQPNQWLPVQDPAGEQGYIAAWYAATAAPGSATPATVPAGTTPPPAPAAGPGGDLIVAPTGDNLALRDQPDVTGNLIKRLPMTANLKVLEPAGDAAKKIGVMGQWVNLRDVTGAEGYVAAWYVTSVDNPALGVKTTLADGGGIPSAAPAQVVRAAVDQLALRSTAAVADNNLIKRLALRAELLVLEPGGQAKIGAQGQWLRVRDLDGAEGYVAAWYVAQ